MVTTISDLSTYEEDAVAADDQLGMAVPAERFALIVAYMRTLRLTRNVTQKRLADLIGLSLRQWTRFETGESDLKLPEFTNAMYVLRGNWDHIVFLTNPENTVDEDQAVALAEAWVRGGATAAAPKSDAAVLVNVIEQHRPDLIAPLVQMLRAMLGSSPANALRRRRLARPRGGS